MKSPKITKKKIQKSEVDTLVKEYYNLTFHHLNIIFFFELKKKKRGKGNKQKYKFKN